MIRTNLHLQYLKMLWYKFLLFWLIGFWEEELNFKLFLYKFLYKKNWPLAPPLCPHVIPGDPDVNKYESTIVKDASTQVSAVLVFRKKFEKWTVFFIHSNVKIWPIPSWPQHALEDHDMNKLESTISVDALTQLFWPKAFWEDFWKILTKFQIF